MRRLPPPSCLASHASWHPSSSFPSSGGPTIAAATGKQALLSAVATKGAQRHPDPRLSCPRAGDRRRTEESLFSSGLQVNPSNVKLLNNMARIEESRQNVESAVAYYRTALQIESRSLRTVTNLGNLYVRLSRLREAESVFLKVRHVCSRFPLRFQTPFSSFPSSNCVADCMTASLGLRTTDREGERQRVTACQSRMRAVCSEAESLTYTLISCLSS